VQEESFFDPSTGKLLGRRLTAEAPIRFVHRLHNAFLLGADGRQVVGLVGLVMAGMILTGLVVWWRPAQGVRRSFLPRWGRGTRLLLDLHTATSLWPFVVIVVLTVTGITMEFPQATRAILGQTGESHGMGRPTRLPSAPTAISADLAMAIAQDTAPEEQLVSLALPSGNHRHWRVVLRPRHGPWRERHQVMVDAESGEIHAEAAATGGMAAAYLALQHALHSGAVFGRLGRVVVLVTGLCLAFLTISGLLVWAKRQMRQSRDATECDCTQDLSAENT